MVTVKTVELRAPGVSTLDAKFLGGRILGGIIFSDFNRQEREIIWKNIVEFKGIIPSLFTFFQDLKLLQACVNGVKWLVTVPRDQTVLTTLESSFKCRDESVASDATERTFRLLSLLAFAMRNYQQMPKRPVKENLLTVPRPTVDRRVLQRFATLARQSGFDSPEIRALEQQQLDSVDSIFEDDPDSVPLLVTTGPGVIIKQRCGIPRIDSFEEDRKHLFPRILCNVREVSGEGITSFFVLKSWFTAFFNPLWWDGQDVSANGPNLPPSQAYEDVHMEVVGTIDFEDREPEPEPEQEIVYESPKR